MLEHELTLDFVRHVYKVQNLDENNCISTKNLSIFQIPRFSTSLPITSRIHFESANISVEFLKNVCAHIAPSKSTT